MKVYQSPITVAIATLFLKSNGGAAEPLSLPVKSFQSLSEPSSLFIARNHSPFTARRVQGWELVGGGGGLGGDLWGLFWAQQQRPSIAPVPSFEFRPIDQEKRLEAALRNQEEYATTRCKQWLKLMRLAWMLF